MGSVFRSGVYPRRIGSLSETQLEIGNTQIRAFSVVLNIVSPSIIQLKGLNWSRWRTTLACTISVSDNVPLSLARASELNENSQTPL